VRCDYTLPRLYFIPPKSISCTGAETSLLTQVVETSFIPGRVELLVGEDIISQVSIKLLHFHEYQSRAYPALVPMSASEAPALTGYFSFFGRRGSTTWKGVV
jgi:hypothetical protein